MKRKLSLLAAALPLLSSGCAHFTAKLADVSYETNKAGVVTSRSITTDLQGTAWFSAAQTLSRFKAVQTDKTQSIGGEGLNQHGSTNAVETLDALTRLMQTLRPMP